MIIDKDIKISINNSNRAKYEKITGKELRSKDEIIINQTAILASARVAVECLCDICNNEFFRVRVNIKKDTTLCGHTCRNEWLKRNNPNPTKTKIPVNCSNCEKPFEVNESVFKGQENFLCSRTCYSEHRKTHYHGDKIYNYQSDKVSCTTCGEKFKTSKWYIENKKHQFCSQECYWIHRKDYYADFYYKTALNDARDESTPERAVREWLESKGMVKGKDFYQEKGLSKKYFLDFYIPKYNMVLEVYGDYWHVNPAVYDVYNNDRTKKPMNTYQSERFSSQRDLKRQLDIESCNYSFKYIWEKEINDDINKYMSIIFDDIKESSNDYT